MAKKNRKKKKRTGVPGISSAQQARIDAIVKEKLKLFNILNRHCSGKKKIEIKLSPEELKKRRQPFIFGRGRPRKFDVIKEEVHTIKPVEKPIPIQTCVPDDSFSQYDPESRA